MLRQTPFSFLLVVVVGLFLGLVGAMEPTSVDVMENEWYNFNCDYNERDDSRKAHELALNIQECSSASHVATTKDQLSASVAVVFGKFSAEEAEIRTEVMRNQDWPLYYANPDNVYVKDGLVQVMQGDVNSISIRVNATRRMDGNCITCNQVKQYRDFESTKKETLKTRNSPTASATVNGLVQSPTSPANGLQINNSVSIVCTASGPAKLSVKLLQNNHEIAASAAGQSSLTHVIARAGRDSAGIYKCQVATDLPFLVLRGQSTGELEFVLAVKFLPEFEVSEIVRYTQIGSNENIRIKVQSYPAAQLTCSPSDMPIRESYNDRQFVNEYDLTLTNLASEKKESTFDCTASNEVGQRQLRIRLTAKAPTPQILSTSNTRWSNSYKLEWQHDQNATIDYYLVQIVYKNSEDNNEVNTTEIKFSPTEQKGAMALVDCKTQNGKLVHSGMLVNLNPDSNHDIRLRSCNGHGCSDFSPSISVKTPAKSAENYNDPRNPMKTIPSKASTMVRGSRAAHLVCLVLAWPLLRAGTLRLLL